MDPVIECWQRGYYLHTTVAFKGADGRISGPVPATRPALDR